MTFDDITTEICTRVNDPLKDTYGDRAEQLVYEGISMLAKSGEFGEEDIPGLIKTKGIEIDELTHPYQINVYGASNDLDNKNVLKIIGITDDPNYIERSTSTFKFIRITIEEYNRLATDTELNPFSDELFYWEINNFLRFFPIDRLTNQYIFVHYIVAPEEYVDTDELVGIYSKSFIYQVINYATKQIRAEIAGG